MHNQASHTRKVYELKAKPIEAVTIGGMHSRSDAGESQRVPKEAKPPACNTGALGGTLAIDHMAGTLKGSTVKEVRQKLGGEWEPWGGGNWRGYLDVWQRREGEEVTIVGGNMKGRPGEVHIQLAGAACRGAGYSVLKSVAQYIEEKQGHLTRLDLAFDDRSGAVTVEQVEQSIEAGQCVTRSREYRVEKGGRLGSTDRGKSIYLGTSQSKTQVVFYDKAAQQRTLGKEVDGPWFRAELRLMKERSEKMAMYLRNLDFELFREMAIGVLIAAVDFRHVQQDDEGWVKAQADQLGWWFQFTEGLKAVRLLVEKIKPSLEVVAQWFENTVAPTLAVLMGARGYGQEFLSKMVVKGVDRFTARHRQLIMASVPLPSIGG